MMAAGRCSGVVRRGNFRPLAGHVVGGHAAGGRAKGVAATSDLLHSSPSRGSPMCREIEKPERKVTVVTGSATGVGAATVLGLARRGYDVVINYTKSEAEAAASAARGRDQRSDAGAVAGVGTSSSGSRSGGACSQSADPRPSA